MSVEIFQLDGLILAADNKKAHLSGHDVTQISNEVFGFLESQLRHILLHVVESGSLEQVLFDEQVQLDDAIRWLARVDAWGQKAGG